MSMLARHIENPGDRRRYPRIDHKVHVFYKPGKKMNQEGAIRDLSERGAFLISRERILPQTPILLYVSMEVNGKEHLCLLQGSVIRLEEKSGAKAYGHGIYFNELKPSTLQILKKFINLNRSNLTSEISIKGL